MANIMNPVFPGAVERSLPPAKSTQVSRSDFSEQLDRRVQESNRSRNDKVGVKHRDEFSSREESTVEPPAGRSNPPKKVEGNGEMNDLLALYLHDLQQISKSNDLGVGEWTVPATGIDLVGGLAEHAGMNAVDLAALMSQVQNDDGSLDLASFFQALETHFTEFDPNPGVLVSETDLPLLESLLSKMGLSQEQLAGLTEDVVVGDGKLDLGKLSDALAQLQTEVASVGLDDLQTALTGVNEGTNQLLQPVTLSEAEVELLQDMLGRAGLNLGEQLDLLPEQLFSKDVVLSFDRLQAMLTETVTQAKSEFSKVEIVPFLQDMERVIDKATFTETGAGISPLVQNSMVDVYKNLLDIFDDVQNRFDEGLAFDETVSMGDVDKWRAGVAKRLASLTGIEPTDNMTRSGQTPDPLLSGVTLPSGSTTLPTGAVVGAEYAGFTTSGEQPLSVEQSIQLNGSTEQPQATRHFSIQQQQHIMNQLSLAVARGMKTGEHHLTLRLHPAELGDVKVDVVMKGDEISAHFSIANSKVKETLESSMDEFRQEMEQKGFNLGEVNVSVGGQDDPKEAWERFEMAWNGEQLQAETLEDLPRGALYSHAHGEEYVNEQGVNIFV